jgi:hypothetical protein
LNGGELSKEWPKDSGNEEPGDHHQHGYCVWLTALGGCCRHDEMGLSQVRSELISKKASLPLG